MTTPNTDQVVLDTSVASLLLRNAAQADYYQDNIAGRRAVISFQTQEESLFGAIKNGWGARRMNQLRRHLDQYETIWATPRVDRHLRPLAQRTGIGRPPVDDRRRLDRGNSAVVALPTRHN